MSSLLLSNLLSLAVGVALGLVINWRIRTAVDRAVSQLKPKHKGNTGVVKMGVNAPPPTPRRDSAVVHPRAPKSEDFEQQQLQDAVRARRR